MSLPGLRTLGIYRFLYAVELYINRKNSYGHMIPVLAKAKQI